MNSFVSHEEFKKQWMIRALALYHTKEIHDPKDRAKCIQDFRKSYRAYSLERLEDLCRKFRLKETHEKTAT